MNYKILLLQTLVYFCSIVLAYLSHINSKKYIKYLFLFMIVSIFLIWVTPHWEKQAKEKIKNQLRPDVKIDFYERKDSQLVVSIQPMHKTTHINTLSLKFDIPGVLEDYNLETLDRAGKCIVHKSFLVGDYKGTTAETIHFWCEDLSPSGYVKVEINYSPTLPRPIYGSENTSYEELFTPLMDLHDYVRCVYTWLFKGEEITETEYIDIANLKFIQKDNENLLYHFQGIRFEEAVKKHNPNYTNPHKARFTKEWLEKLEESRKDW